MKRLFPYIILSLFLCVNITAQASDPCTYVLENSGGTLSGSLTIESPEMTVNGPADVLSFSAKRNKKPAVGDVRVYAYYNNKWNDVSGKLNFGVANTKTYNFSYPIDENTTKIKFVRENGTYSHDYSNVRISRKKFVRSSTNSISITTDKDNASIPIYYGHSGQATFTVNWSCGNVSTNQITLSIDNSAFTFANGTTSETITGVSCNNGSNTFTITYQQPASNPIGTSTGTLTIKEDGAEKATISLSGTTIYKTQTAEWYNAENEIVDEFRLSVGETFAYKSDIFPNKPATYTFSPAGLMEADEEGNIHALQAGRVSVIATVAGDHEYDAIADTKTITIINEYVQRIEWTQSLRNIVLSEVSQIELTATATAYVGEQTTAGANTPIVYTSSNPAVASVEGNILHIHALGETTITATKAGGIGTDGNQYAAARSVERTVKVNSEFSVCENNIFDQELSDWNSPQEMGTTGLNNNPKEIQFNGVEPDLLTFTIKRQSTVLGDAAGTITVEQYVNGRWIDAKSSFRPSASYEAFSVSLNHSATAVRFNRSAGTLLHYIKDVVVTRNTFIRPSVTDITIDKDEINNPIYAGEAGTATFDVHWSCRQVNNITATIEMSDEGKESAFTLSQYTIDNVSCNEGKTRFTVTYSEPGTHAAGTSDAVLTLTDGQHSATINLHGSTQERTQTFEWKVPNKISTGSAYNAQNEVFTSTLSATKGVTYTFEPANVLQLQNDTVWAMEAGEVTITATVEGDNDYAAISQSKTITVTEDLIQHIVWTQTFRNIIFDEAHPQSFTLTAKATSDIECATNNSRLIEYSVDNPAVASVVGNTLQINGVGTATLTATQAGGEDADGHTYASVTAERKVVVHDANYVCEDYVFNHDESELTNPYEIFRGTTAEVTVEMELNGEPEFLSFSVMRKPWKLVVEYSDGEIRVDEYVNGNWSEIYNCGTPTKNAYDEHPNIRLSRNATKIRFRRPSGGTGYHYIKDVFVTRARYIETQDNEMAFAAVLGQTLDSPTTFSYSNAVGDIALNFIEEDAPFIVSSPLVETECGVPAKNVPFTITYQPSVLETNAAYTLRITDGTTSKDIALRATATTRVFTFNAEDNPGNDTENWNEPDNWKDTEYTPTEQDKVFIQTNLTITEPVAAYEMVIENNAVVTIAPTGSLTLGAGGIIGANENNLILQTDATGQTGALRISPKCKNAMPRATIQLYKRSSGAESENYWERNWQYVGCPVDNTSSGALNDYQNTWLVQWNNADANWSYLPSRGEMTPFRGYGLTQKTPEQGHIHAFVGQLFAPSVKTIPLDYNTAEDQDQTYTSDAGFNLLANSWAAPISIAALTEEAFQNAEATIYLYNTGNTDAAAMNNAEDNAAGTYTAIPVNISAPAGYKVIPAMQGFFVLANGTDASLTLDYNTVVMTDPFTNTPNHIRRGTVALDPCESCTEEDEDDFIMQALYISIATDNGGKDEVRIYQNETFTEDFDNGYDGTKLLSGLAHPQIMVLDANRQLAVAARPEFNNTRIAFRASNLTDTYTLTVERSPSTVEYNLYLFDLVTEERITITQGATYTFTATNTDPEMRFVIEQEFAPQVETSITDNKRKYAYVANGILYTGLASPIEVTIYTIDGKPIITKTVESTLSLNFLPQGTYIFRLNGTTLKFIR